jgi:hypothetical protein
LLSPPANTVHTSAIALTTIFLAPVKITALLILIRTILARTDDGLYVPSLMPDSGKLLGELLNRHVRCISNET